MAIAAQNDRVDRVDTEITRRNWTPFGKRGREGDDGNGRVKGRGATSAKIRRPADEAESSRVGKQTFV